MANKKILIFSHEFPPFGGGAGVVAKDYAYLLSSQGHSVTVLTRDIKGIEENESYKIKIVKTLPKVWFISYIKAIDYDKFDVIILNDNASVYFAGMFFSKKLLSKSIAFLHGSEPENIFEKPSKLKKLFAFRYFYTKALMSVKKIIAVSNFMKEKFLSRTNLIQLEHKIEVQYTSIDTNIFYKEKDEKFREKLSIDNSANILLSVSRIVEGKGYFEMIEIFKKLVSENNDYVWIVIGTGDYLNTLENLVTQYKLEKNVIFLGVISRDKLRYYYSNVDIFWLLSNFDESFGLVYLEAQACGCPVLGRNKAGVKEAIEDLKSGFLVHSQEEVLEILKSKKYLELKQDDIFCFASRFSLNKQAKVLERFLWF